MSLTKNEYEEEQQAFLAPREPREGISSSRKASSRSLSWHLRFALEMAMGFTIVFLLARPYLDKKISKPSPVPSCMPPPTLQRLLIR